jgi:hypothetical protein
MLTRSVLAYGCAPRAASALALDPDSYPLCSGSARVLQARQIFQPGVNIMHNTNPSQTSNNIYATARDAVNPDFLGASSTARVSINRSAQRQRDALKEISKMLASHPEASVGNSKVHYCLCLARNATRAER